jgi:hypothetical protein
MWIPLEGSARRRRQWQGPSRLDLDGGETIEQERVKVAQLELKEAVGLCKSLMRAQPSDPVSMIVPKVRGGWKSFGDPLQLFPDFGH